jgi:apyrase
MRLGPDEVGFVLTQRSAGPAGAPPVHGQYKDRVEVRPGLPEAVDSASGDAAVSAYLAPLLDWGRAAVPWGLHRSTPVLMLGTAGMRRLPAKRQEALLASGRRVLAMSGFYFEPEYVRVLSGAEEGAYGWLALNFLDGRLLPEPGAGARALAPQVREPQLLGALDMGGSSMEVTHMPRTLAGGEDWAAAGHNVTLFGRSYPLSVHTLRGAGLGGAFGRGVRILADAEQAKASPPGSSLLHPCLHSGYKAPFEREPGGSQVLLEGAYDTQQCAALAEKVVAELDPGCAEAGQLACVTAGSGRSEYVGLSGFYVVFSFFGLDMAAEPSELAAAGEAFCQRPWRDVQADREGVMSLEDYCFRSFYISRLLGQLGVGSRFKAAEIEGWALGAALLAASSTRHLREPVDLGKMVAAAATDISAMRQAASSMQHATTQQLQLLIAAIALFSVLAACQYLSGRSQRRRMEQLSLHPPSPAAGSWLGSDPRGLELGRVPSAPKRSSAHKRCASRDDVRLLV